MAPSGRAPELRAFAAASLATVTLMALIANNAAGRSLRAQSVTVGGPIGLVASVPRGDLPPPPTVGAASSRLGVSDQTDIPAAASATASPKSSPSLTFAAFALVAPAMWLAYLAHRWLHPRKDPLLPFHAIAVSETVEPPVTDPEFDPRAFRRSLNKTGRYNRKVLKDAESLALMESDGVGYSRSGLVAQMRSGTFEHTQGDVTVRLAQAYGFCWGVERAVQMAYETRRSFPDRDIFITNEIIHNPTVNQRLEDMGLEIMEGNEEFAKLKAGDVAVLPAFGASVHVMKDLLDRNVQIVDTTCPWVSKVWNAVGSQKEARHTSIVHGKWAHEETIATVSFAGDYLVVKDLKQAKYLSEYILKGGDKEEFLKYYGPEAMSKGFDPETMLEKIGLANQTTMLKGETVDIGKLLESTMMQKYGPQNLNQHYMVMDTICDATQERQDAMYDLLKEGEHYDLVIVVGGFNSSNTSHLQEICEHKNVKGYWIDSADRVDVASNTICHKMSWGELVETKGWLPAGKLRIAVTSGASTPDKAIEDVLDKVFRIKDPAYAGIQPRECAPLVTPDH
jgi:4-hydroxy-3-methylbut-2-enyl diphosphate reductase